MRNALFDTLCCPDDGAAVVQEDHYLECLECHRRFTILANNMVEMLPSEFPAWNLACGENRAVEASYRKLFEEKFTWDQGRRGWGDFASASAGYRAFVKSERETILEVLKPRSGSMAIDFSGGVGNYSIFLSDFVETMVHCELHVPSILSAYRSANDRNKKMLFIRTPYLKVPFNSEAFDYAICTDTLIRGKDHDRRLVNLIYNILKPGGRAVVDFHNPRFLAKKGYKKIQFYSAEEIRGVFLDEGIPLYSIFDFGFVPNRLVVYEWLYSGMDQLFKLISSPVRYIVVMNKEKR